MVSKMRNWVLVAFITLLLIASLELIVRLAYPEFSGHIHARTTSLGKNVYMAADLPVRVPAPVYRLSFKTPIIVVLGDSVSHGYGIAYEDIYWQKVQRLLTLKFGDTAPTIVSLSYAGNDLGDSSAALRDFINRYPTVTIKDVIYQFNFNDIVPSSYSRAALRDPFTINDQSRGVTTDQVVDPKPLSSTEISSRLAAPGANSIFKRITAWRYEYLNYSTLFRLTQHYASWLARKTSGTCQQRGLDALGPYTWSHGSEPFLTESEQLWGNFSTALSQLNQTSQTIKAQLSILISPLLFHVDTKGEHPYYNYLNYDFTCARIDPTARLKGLADKLGVTTYDPTSYMQESFNNRIKEGNFEAFYLTADENHLTPVAASLMGEYLYSMMSK